MTRRRIPPRRIRGKRVSEPPEPTAPAPRVHEGPETDAVLQGLNAPGAAFGRDILIASDLDAIARAAVLAHETTHVRQTGGRVPTGPPIIGPGDRDAEREAQIAGALGTPLSPRSDAADPRQLRLYDENQLLRGTITPAWADALSEDELRSAVEAIRAQIDSLEVGSASHTTALENHATLEDSVLRRDMEEALPPPQPVDLALDDKRPWIVRVADEGATPRDIAHELYGIDISAVMPREEIPFSSAINTLATLAGMPAVPTQGAPVIVQDMLRPKYLEEFHLKMEALLARDMAKSKKILLYDLPDLRDVEALQDLNAYWSRRNVWQARNGGTYYDAYLTALDSSYIVTNWGVTESNRRSYLDELYAVTSGFPGDDRVGDVNTRVARKSEVYGSYIPYWKLDEDLEAPAGTTEPNEKLVDRSANLILDRMEGITLPTQSAAIVEVMTGLPPGVQKAVLDRIMAAHEQTIAWGLLGRFGEPTGEHMLYNLFENLDDADAKELSEALQENGLLTETGGAKLVEGRSWAGRNLPWTTYHGAQAAAYWQEEYDQGGSWLNLVGAGFAGLWTPETASETILALVTARVGLPLASRAPQGVQKALLTFGTGTGAYAATTALLEAATGETANGTKLKEGQRVTRMIQGIMEIAFLAEGVAAAKKFDPSGGALVKSPEDLPSVRPATGSASTAVPRLPAPEGPGTGLAAPGIAGGGAGGVRVINIDPDGEILAVARSAQGEHAFLSIDMKTGNGRVLFPDRGVHPVEGFMITGQRKALPGGDGTWGVGGPTALPKGPPSAPRFVESQNAYSVPGRSYPGRQQVPVAPGASQTLPSAASARTPRSQRTAIDADLAEVDDYKTLLLQGEIGLAGTNGAQRRGPDSITYDPVTKTIYVNDSQTYWTGTPKANKSTAVPPDWRTEARNAAANVNIGNSNLEDEIKAAAAIPGKIRRRNLPPRQVAPPDPGTGPYIDIGPDIDGP